MDILWLITVLLSVQFLCGNSLARVIALPIPKDSVGHGTLYRFQYFVRDERGDYETQEEMGEDSNTGGSYVVKKPDGDLRIIQYIPDIGRGLKTYMKLSSTGKSSDKLEKISIPVEEMSKLIEENRKKVTSDDLQVREVDESLKSYVLDPPRKISEIVLEQAAAIREIISKEIEAEGKREAEERERLAGKKFKEENNETSIDTVDCDEDKMKKESNLHGDLGIVDGKELEAPVLIQEIDNSKKNNCQNISAAERKFCLLNSDRNSSRTAKEKKFDTKEMASVESLQNSQILNKNSRNTKKIIQINDGNQSPVVRVALGPRNIEQLKIDDFEKAELNNKEIHEGLPSSPVQNFSFKNRILFYKPAERKISQIVDPNLSGIASADEDSKSIPKPNIVRLTSLSKNLRNHEKSNTAVNEEILFFSPYQQDTNKGDDRKSRNIAVPYEIPRPYLATRNETNEKERSK